MFFNNNKEKQKQTYIHLNEAAQSERLVLSNCLSNESLNLLPVPRSQELITQTGYYRHALFEIHHLLFQSWYNLVVWQTCKTYDDKL